MWDFFWLLRARFLLGRLVVLVYILTLMVADLQRGASRSSRVSSRSYEQRTNNARTTREQRTNNARAAYEQRVRTRTNNEPGISQYISFVFRISSRFGRPFIEL